MGEGIEIDGVIGDGLGVSTHLRGDDLGVLEPGSSLGGSSELGGELSEVQMLGLGLDQPKGGGIPETGRSTV